MTGGHKVQGRRPLVDRLQSSQKYRPQPPVQHSEPLQLILLCITQLIIYELNKLEPTTFNQITIFKTMMNTEFKNCLHEHTKCLTLFLHEKHLHTAEGLVVCMYISGYL